MTIMAQSFCVNALNGLFSFLQGEGKGDMDMEKCVNALNGLFSFLQWEELYKGIILTVCQCPKRDFFISTMIEK